MFSERLEKRAQAWWTPVHRTTSFKQWIDLPTRFTQRRKLMSRQDPMSAWQRGRHWQRRLNNKWNSRELAARLGFQVPELYWHGRNPRRIPFADLPTRFVTRSAWGQGGRSVYVISDGYEHLRRREMDAAELVADLKKRQEKPWPFPILVEEFLRGTDGNYRQLVDHKFHCFNGHVGAIAVQAGRKAGKGPPRVNYYDNQWRPLAEPMRDLALEIVDFPRPRSFENMLECARAISHAFGSYVRVDLYDTHRGCVFGEIASWPSDGKNFSTYADRLLGECWTRHCDQAI